MEKITDPVLISLLKKYRQDLNSIWYNRQTTGRRITAPSFLEFWKKWLEQPAGGQTLCLQEDFPAYFQSSLDLYQRFYHLSPELLNADLNLLLRGAAVVPCRDPGLVHALVSALDQLLTLSPEAALFWVRAMAGLTEAFPDDLAWKNTGLVLAWLSGLVRYRESALALLMEDEQKIWQLLSRGEGSSISWQEFRANIWSVLPGFSPRIQGSSCYVEGFSGLGGRLSHPPLILGWDQTLQLCSGEQVYDCYIDAYGTDLVPVAGGEVPGEASLPGKLVTQIQSALPAHWPGAISSALRYGDTLFFTSSLSFHIFILAGLP